MSNYRHISNMIWNIANLLRGSWKAYEYQDVILPLTVLKRLDAALEPTKHKALERFNELESKVSDLRILRKITGYDFYNTSPFTFKKLLEDQTHIARNLRKYIDGFSDNVKDIFSKFDFDKQLERLEGSDILYLIIQEFNKLELHPDKVTNHEIGLAFEDLIRRFAEQSNDTAGEHYTPRDVVRLMTALIFSGEEKELSKPGVVKTLYDPACGTGGMLTIGKEYIQTNFNKNAKIYLYGQELNSLTYAICKADMLLKNENIDNIKGGEKPHDQASTLSNDQHFDKKFDYIISNPPYGVEWKKDKTAVENEFNRGFTGRFGAGLPRISDGQFLFLQHAISKFKPVSEGGSEAVIITNGSPLFTGDAGQGESEIRRWIFENDYLDALIALPDQLFFNTGIPTYIWVFSNRKPEERKNKVMLVDARAKKSQLRKNLGSKRYEVTETQIKEIINSYLEYKEGKNIKIFDTSEFGYRSVTIQRPLRLKFEITKENIEKLKNNSTLLVDESFEKIVFLLNEMLGKKFMSRNKFLEFLNEKLKEKSLKLSAKIINTIWKELGEHDDESEICLDKDGKPEQDNELKDAERVPFNENVYEYFEKEVRPYVPDAWIDETVRDEKDGKIGKVGYEISFTRYFYKYIPPRDPEVIQKEIVIIEKEISKLMTEI